MKIKKILLAGIVLSASLIVALSAYGIWRAMSVPPVAGTAPSARYDLGGSAQFVQLDSPVPADKVMSPLTVTGKARLWYFEASFPVELKDGNGKVLAVAPAQAQGDWMTEDFVPFKAVLVFSKPETASGTLTLKKDNPSGLPEFDAQVSVPVRFDLSSAAWAGGSPAGCRPTGCSGHVCSDEDVVTDCMYLPEYACYRTAACGRGADGRCGWVQTPELSACLDNAKKQ